MAAPVSPGDVLALAQGVYKLYKKFRSAPEEMKELGEQVKHVQIMLRFFKTQASQLEFLNSSDGKELSDDLERHLRKLRRLLRKVKDIGKQWRKAKKNFLRKLPFIFYTMRAVPDLNKGIIDRLFYINRDRELALQAGINLGSGALNQIKTAIKEELARARAAEKSKKAAVDDAEWKRRAATSALKRAASSWKPTSLIELKTEAEKELKQSGLPEADTQKLTVLFETELQNATNRAKLVEFRAANDTSSKTGMSVKSSKSSQRNKPKVKSHRIIIQHPPNTKEEDDQKKDKQSRQVKVKLPWTTQDPPNIKEEDDQKKDQKSKQLKVKLPWTTQDLPDTKEEDGQKKDKQSKQPKQDQKEKDERGKSDASREWRFLVPEAQQPKHIFTRRRSKEKNSNSTEGEEHQ